MDIVFYHLVLKVFLVGRQSLDLLYNKYFLSIFFFWTSELKLINWSSKVTKLFLSPKVFLLSKFLKCKCIVLLTNSYGTYFWLVITWSVWFNFATTLGSKFFVSDEHRVLIRQIFLKTSIWLKVWITTCNFFFFTSLLIFVIKTSSNVSDSIKLKAIYILWWKPIWCRQKVFDYTFSLVWITL